MNIQIDQIKIKSTLKKTSLDDAGAQNLVEDEKEVYDFDEVSREIASQIRLGNAARSCDALYIGSKYTYLIEFKNKKSSDLKKCKNELFEKAYDSIFQLMIAFYANESMDDIVKKTRFVLVYNDAKAAQNPSSDISSSTSIDQLTKKLKEFSKQEDLDKYPKKFKLKQLEGKLYEKIITIDVTDFNSEVKDIIFK